MHKYYIYMDFQKAFDGLSPKAAQKIPVIQLNTATVTERQNSWYFIMVKLLKFMVFSIILSQKTVASDSDSSSCDFNY